MTDSVLKGGIQKIFQEGGNYNCRSNGILSMNSG